MVENAKEGARGVKSFQTALSRWKQEQLQCRSYVETMVNAKSRLSHYEAAASAQLRTSTPRIASSSSLSSTAMSSAAPVPPELVMQAADEVTDCTQGVQESQSKMIALLDIMAEVASQLTLLNDAAPVEPSLFASVVDQVRQQALLEMTAVERLLASPLGAGSDTEPDESSESEIITLTSCFTYMPYIDPHLIQSILAI